jgi:hypothetical protein
MTNPEPDNEITREDLLQRVALMETMIAEGRSTTAHYGWIFVLWGLVDLSGMGWQWLQPHSYWVWPVTIGTGFLIQIAAVSLRRKTGEFGDRSTRSRSVQAVWSMMALGVSLYCAAAIERHVTWQISYVAAILMLVGLAHATSSVILRWQAQAVVAALWWAGGIASFFLPGMYLYLLVVAELLFGLVAFGLYAMLMERRRAAARVQHHA